MPRRLSCFAIEKQRPTPNVEWTDAEDAPTEKAPARFVQLAHAERRAAKRDRSHCLGMVLTQQMETKNHSRAEYDEKVERKPVKEIVEPATAVPGEASVAAALEKMQAHSDESAAVTCQGGKLVGGVSKNKLNRTVGGMGHDPHAFPVEPQMDKDVAHCVEDQTIGEAENVMREAKVEEVPVVTREKSLVGKATLHAIERKKQAEKQDLAEDLT